MLLAAQQHHHQQKQQQQHIHQIYNRNSLSVSFNLYNIRLCFYIVQQSHTYTNSFSHTTIVVHIRNANINYFIFHFPYRALSLTLSFNLVLDFCGEKYCDSAKLFVALFSLNNKFVLFVFLELPKNQNSKISIFSQLSLYILLFSLSFAKLYIFFKIQVKIKKKEISGHLDGDLFLRKEMTAYYGQIRILFDQHGAKVRFTWISHERTLMRSFLFILSFSHPQSHLFFANMSFMLLLLLLLLVFAITYIHTFTCAYSNTHTIQSFN